MQKHRSHKLYIAKGRESLYNPSQAWEKGDFEEKKSPWMGGLATETLKANGSNEPSSKISGEKAKIVFFRIPWLW